MESDDNRPSLTIVAGPNGAGKSTLVEEAQRDNLPVGPFVNPDIIAANLDGPESSKAARAGREALRHQDELISNRQSFTRETTLTGNSALKTMQRAKDAGYQVNLLFVGVDSVEISKQRVANRVAKGGHDIPEDAQERRFDRSMANAVKASNIADVAAFYNNETGKGHDLQAVVQNGHLIHVADRPSSWVHNIARQVPTRNEAVALSQARKTFLDKVPNNSREFQAVRAGENVQGTLIAKSRDLYMVSTSANILVGSATDLPKANELGKSISFSAQSHIPQLGRDHLSNLTPDKSRANEPSDKGLGKSLDIDFGRD